MEGNMIKIEVKTKKCTKCGIERELGEFSKNRSTKTGREYSCKDCMQKYREDNKERMKENRKRHEAKPGFTEKNRERKKKYREENRKEINKNARERREENKEEINRKARGRHEKNKDEVNRKHREYYKKNKDEVNKKHREYYQKNKKEILKKNKEYQKTPKAKKRRRELDNLRGQEIFVKIKKSISHAVWVAIKNYKDEKEETILNFLPYSLQELREHLESQFEPWMDWKNYGKANDKKRTWTLEHIYPQSKLKYESIEDENFWHCWNLYNLKPLDAKENIRKSNKILINSDEKKF